MARPRSSILNPPKYRLNRARGQAFVEIDGKRRYLGVHGTPESWAKYYEAIAGLGATGPTPPAPPPPPAITPTAPPPTSAPAAEAPMPEGVTVAELADRYLTYCETYYRAADGTQTTEVRNMRRAIRPVVDLYGRFPAAGFRPLMLKAVREQLMGFLPGAPKHVRRRGRRVRKAVNGDVSRVRMMFAWGVENELVPESTYGALKLVKGLRAYRSEAPESEPVRPVAVEHVQAVEPYVSRQVWALVELQRLTGARPGELLKLRPCDLDTTSTPWAFTPEAHKTAHHGITRTIYFGPRAQAVLTPFLKGRRTTAYMFSPREAEAARAKNRRAGRRTPLYPSHVRHMKKKRRGRKLGPYYDRERYARAIARACEKAGVPHWHPNQLRHLAATELRRKHGIDVAQTILGHRLGSSITEIYAEANTDKAKAVLRKIG